jgi:hypothetical protein
MTTKKTPTAGMPAYLTVEEAAVVLRIGRTSAYAFAREFLATGGLAGLPVIRLGKQLRVPTAALERLVGNDGNRAAQAVAPVVSVPRTPRRRTRQPTQPPFPFEA